MKTMKIVKELLLLVLGGIVTAVVIYLLLVKKPDDAVKKEAVKEETIIIREPIKQVPISVTDTVIDIGELKIWIRKVRDSINHK